MFVTVVAVMCKLMVAYPVLAADTDCTAEESRIEEIITDTDKDPQHIDFFGCQIRGQIIIADWKGQHPIYFKDSWRVARMKCVPGHYVPKGEA